MQLVLFRPFQTPPGLAHLPLAILEWKLEIEIQSRIAIDWMMSEDFILIIESFILMPHLHNYLYFMRCYRFSEKTL